jgi:hypothetical protein
MLSTWRSTKDSHEHSAMPTHGTHIRQSVRSGAAEAVGIVGVTHAS